MRSASRSLTRIPGSACAIASTQRAATALPRSASLGRDDDARRLAAEIDSGMGAVPAHLEHAEAALVEHATELVEAVHAHRVLDLASPAGLEQHGPLDDHSTREEVELH